MRTRAQSVRAAFVALVVACLAVPVLPGSGNLARADDPNCPSSDPNWPCFVLKVGEAGDEDDNQDIYLIDPDENDDPNDPNTILSGPVQVDTHCCRILNPTPSNAAAYGFEFRLKTAGLHSLGGFFDGHNAPTKDAIITIGFQDTYSCPSSGVVCNGRPRLYTRLDRGGYSTCKVTTESECDELQGGWAEDAACSGASTPPDDLGACVYERFVDWYCLGAFGGWGDGLWGPGGNYGRPQQFFIEATPFTMLREREIDSEGYFRFKIEYPGQGGGLPIDWIMVQFVDAAIFDPAREADRAARTLARADFVDSGTPPAPNNECFALYARHYLEKIYSNTVPDQAEVVYPSSDQLTLTAFEVAGEREPVTFAVYAFENLTGVSVAATDLKGDAGTIPASKVEIAAVMFNDRRWAWTQTEYYGSQPWYLDPLYSPMDIAAGESRQFWITVDTKGTNGSAVPPGRYNGTLTISGACDGSPFSEKIALSIVVYDVALDAPASSPCLIFGSPYGSSLFANDPNTAFQDQAAHDILPEIVLNARLFLDPNYQIEYIDFRDLGSQLTDWSTAAAALSNHPPWHPRVRMYDVCVVDGMEQGALGYLWVHLCEGYPGDPNDPNCGVKYCATCPDLDAVYGSALTAYKDFFDDYGLAPVLTFSDEPCSRPDSRRAVNFFNRLAHEAGLETWVTYYPAAGCDELDQLGVGFTLTFEDLTAAVDRTLPDLLDPNSSQPRAYWAFNDPNDSSPDDSSGNGNHGTLNGDAEITLDGTLRVYDDPNDYMQVADDDTLDFASQATIYAWFKPYTCTTANRAIINKTGNYLLYFALYASDPAVRRVYCTGYLDGSPRTVSGSEYLACSTPPMERWYNLLWRYDADDGGALFVDGVRTPLSVIFNGELDTSSAALKLGMFDGELDNVLMFNRLLDPNEIYDVVDQLNSGYNTQQTIKLTLDVSGDPNQISFVIDDNVAVAHPDLETLKEFRIKRDGEDWTPIWSAHELPCSSLPVTVDWDPNGLTGLQFRFTNNQSRREKLGLYIMDDDLRKANWVVTYDPPPDSRWSYTYEADPDGYNGPLSRWLDIRVLGTKEITETNILRTEAAGDRLAFYDTGPGTQAVPVNNRFLHGIYAAALGADVFAYAYGAWGTLPWDDTEQQPTFSIRDEDGRRGWGGQQFVAPSWDDLVYDTTAFECLREGVEDSRIIATLAKAIADADANNPCLEAAEDYLNGLLGKPSPNWEASYGFWEQTWIDANQPELYADRSAEMLEDLCDDASNYGFFDEMRLQMIRYIAALTDPNDCNTNGVPDACEIVADTSKDCDPDGILDACQGWCKGDMNCSRGVPTFDDINYFSAAVSGESAWWDFYVKQNGKEPCCPWQLGDFSTPPNGVDFYDMKPFVASIGQPCQPYEQ